MVVSGFAALAAHCLGDSYIDRLSDHAGLYLVAADNDVGEGPLVRPARAIVIVVDGLREDAAREMKATAALSEAGQCRTTNVGALSVSRPVYALISTGLEADRTGARNNDDPSPIGVESIWEVARDAGLHVSAASELLWWQQLFPRGFDDYLVVADPTQNIFERAALADLTLIHPVYVDEAGHDHGGTSASYRAAVARVDADLAAFISGLDLERDLVVLTADHGHSRRGGHGSPSRDVSRVLSCWAGPGVTHSAGGAMDARTIAPTLAVLLGLPFPRHMRAVDDDLDTVWDIVEADAVGAPYAARRTLDIEGMRATNRVALGRWLGADPDEARWTALYEARGRRSSLLYLGALALALLGLVVSLAVRRLTWRRSALVIAWMIAIVATSIALYIAMRGSLDFTSINRRALFIRTSLMCCGAAVAAGVGVHLAVWRDLQRLTIDLVSLVLVVTAADAAHPLVYGWRMGFPLPGPTTLFGPFFMASLIAALGVAAFATAGATLYPLLRARRPNPSGR